jgi:hypothetical protein
MRVRNTRLTFHSSQKRNSAAAASLTPTIVPITETLETLEAP